MQANTILGNPNTKPQLADTLNDFYDTVNQTKATSFLNQSINPLNEQHLKPEHEGDWISGLLLLAFVLLSISNFLFRKRFRDLFKAFWARNYSNQLVREGNIFKERFGLNMFLFYLASIPFFYAITISHFYSHINVIEHPYLFLEVILISLLPWCFRLLFIKLTAIIFNTPKSSAEVIIQLFIFNMVSAVAVLPFVGLFYYSDLSLFLYAAITIWFLIQFYRFIRLFVIGFSYAIFSGLHLFLYLCTLEIIPIVILLKILSKIYL